MYAVVLYLNIHSLYDVVLNVSVYVTITRGHKYKGYTRRCIHVCMVVYQQSAHAYNEYVVL